MRGQVPDPDARIKGASLFDTWSRELGRLGDDGSDHGGEQSSQHFGSLAFPIDPDHPLHPSTTTVFVQRLGVPATMLGFNQGDYSTYHSVFDNYDWMAHFGDPGFHRHVAVAQVWGAVALALAEAKDLPLNYVDWAAALAGYVQDVRRHLIKAGGAARVFSITFQNSPAMPR